jgi:hypothetical protein
MHHPNEFNAFVPSHSVQPPDSGGSMTSAPHFDRNLALDGSATFWDQDFLAFFEQMGPQYPLLQPDAGINGDVSVGSWGNYQG